MSGFASIDKALLVSTSLCGFHPDFKVDGEDCLCSPCWARGRIFQNRGAPDAAHAWRGYLVTVTGKYVCCVFGFVLSLWAPLRMYLFGTMKGYNGPVAISKIMK